MRAFLDTNVILYAFTADPVRRPIAQLLLESDFEISVQVLNEFANASRRKFNREWDAIEFALRKLRHSARSILALTDELNKRGLQLARRYQLSVYDSMIVAAALEARCDTLYSEDMHDGLVIEDRLTIRNPFA